MDLYCNNIVLGSEISENFNFKLAASLSPRDILPKIQEYSQSNTYRTGVLLGLRRTGKSVLLRQWLLNLPYEEKNKAAYLTIDGENFSDIKHDLNILRKHGYKYIVLDEITTSKNFIERCASLSDNYCSSGMKLFISGTDSLSLLYALSEGLFDRNYTLRTTHIPYAEWSRLTFHTSIDDYIRWGGLLHLEPTEGELRHSIPMSWTASELCDYSAWTADKLREYFTSSISNNILNSIRNYKDGENAGLLGQILNETDMDSAVYGLFGSLVRQKFINCLSEIADINEDFLMSAFQSLILTESHTYDPKTMNRKFKLPDISRTKSAFAHKNDKLNHELYDELYDVLENIIASLRDNAESMLHIKNFIGNYVQVSQFLRIVDYLKSIEVFAMRPVLAFPPENATYADFKEYNDINNELHTQNLVSQPGLRYGQANIMWRLVKDNVLFQSLPPNKQDIIDKTFHNGVYGTMQEDIILFETMQNCKKFSKMNLSSNDWLTYNSLPIKSYKAIFPRIAADQKDKEIDMIIEDHRDEHLFYLIEIKYSDKQYEEQKKWLVDTDVKKRLRNGRIKSKIVLYNGISSFDGDVKYINIGEYLEKLHYNGIEDVLKWFDDNRNH